MKKNLNFRFLKFVENLFTDIIGLFFINKYSNFINHNRKIFNFSKLNFHQLANFKSILQPIWIIGISFCLSFLLTQNLSISSIQNLFFEILFIGALALISNKELRGLFLIKE